MRAPALPTIDEIESLTPGERAVFRGVDWGFYMRRHDVVGERPWLRIAYDGRDLEVMWVGPLQGLLGARAAGLVEVLTEELEILFRSAGSTTWMRPVVERGIEADASYYFSPAKMAVAVAALRRRSNDVAEYPDPDLAIEINVTPPEVDHLGIYAALKVAEVWQFSTNSVTIERLGRQGTYSAAETSGFLPIRGDDVARWVLEDDAPDDLAWRRPLRAWIRAELSDRGAG